MWAKKKMTKKVPVKVYDEEGNEVILEVRYRSVVDERTGMTHWQMEPGQDLSGPRLLVNPDLRLVSIGGGTGQPIVLKGLKRYLFPEPASRFIQPVSRERLTAVVTMTDDGGSSGRLRDEMNVLPPGDIRNCLIGLSEDEALMTRLLKYRFQGENGLSGHSLGNLMLAALSEMHQNFLEAVTDVSSILAIRGRILPSTVEHAVLGAELKDGSVVRGESSINACPHPIRRIMLEPPDVRPLDQVIDALERAHGIIVGPGSLFTSILPNLMIRGVAEAIQRSSAVTVLVTNLMTEPEETRGFTVGDHLRSIEEHIGYQVIDHALVNKTPLPGALLSQYAEDGAEVTAYDVEGIHGLGVNPVEADLLSDDPRKVRHDPEKLARSLLNLFSLG